MAISIIKSTGTNCTSSLPGRSIKYLVIHYSAGTSSKKGSARDLINWFKNKNCSGSADFAVDDEEIVQYNGDIKNRYCWAVGGSKYSSMTTKIGGELYGKCTNKNCIGIEIISNKTNKKSLGAEDSDWYFTKEEITNAVELAKYLMKQYNIPIERVITHHQVTGKICPNPWVLNDDRLSGWYEFKSRLSGESSISGSSSPSNSPVDTTSGSKVSYSVKVKATSGLNIRKGPGSTFGKVAALTNGTIKTIIRECKGWGLLSDKSGWISLEYALRLDSSNTVTTNSNTKPTASPNSFQVKVTADSLKIRSGPGTNFNQVGSIKDKGTYTIISTESGPGSSTGWGRLLSGAGWISLDYTKRK